MITSANATFQMSVAPEMRGRVMALYMMIFMGGTPIGSPIVGWVGETFGARWTLIGGGVATILGTALAVLVFSRAQGLIGHAHDRTGTAHAPSEEPERAEREVGAAGEVVAGRA
jgi:MFS family permease